jgi:hypothetical protein
MEFRIKSMDKLNADLEHKYEHTHAIRMGKNVSFAIA